MERNEQEQKSSSQEPESCATPAKPLKVLSTSLGVALAANLLMSSSAMGQQSAAQSDQAKLVEWSTEEVKQYFDANMDWNIPLPEEEEIGDNAGSSTSGGSGSSGGSSSSSGTSHHTYVHHGGGFGWDDMLLYHMIFNRGNAYSSSSWSSSGSVYDTRTNSTYRAKSFSSDSFQNRPVVNSRVRPSTSNGSGSIIRRSAVGSSKSSSSSPGGIGGKSSSFSSSSSSRSGGWFGG
ncbi:hypothetical protein ABE142_24790 [Paenibacillus alvei]|uniref:hypothetical protein n=1 Tax=Paenibacillus alvei TaxID=44250 RepID=UPI0018CE82AA|nr:hypothetical protein [Paenibacillus alvei]MBG9733318.1 hypothetical protein [Paenibacillus alvei]MBG9745123.1 hypothetical protein [Paenibacillus alvei]MCY9580750.1 hypothetical protein [Paenibacillus alvei]MCY9585233.1 hypothetical protein [Paenibacillus alvei]